MIDISLNKGNIEVSLNHKDYPIKGLLKFQNKGHSPVFLKLCLFSLILACVHKSDNFYWALMELEK